MISGSARCTPRPAHRVVVSDHLEVWSAASLQGCCGEAKPPTKSPMLKPNIYAILSRCIHDGLNQGFSNVILSGELTRNTEDAKENIHIAIMREITEYFDIPANNE